MDHARRNAVGKLAALLATGSALGIAKSSARTGPRQVAVPIASPRGQADIEAAMKWWTDEFRKQGLESGRDIQIRIFPAASTSEMLGAARGAVESHPDIIVTQMGAYLPFLRAFTHDIPIVTAWNDDFMEVQGIGALGRHGTNVTGVMLPFTDMFLLRMALLKEIRPAARRWAILWKPVPVGDGVQAAGEVAGYRRMMARLDARARQLGLEMKYLEPVNELEFKSDLIVKVVDELRRARSDIAEVTCFWVRNPNDWGRFVRMGLPVSTYCKQGVMDGALLGGWWISPPGILARLAARILGGEKVGELPWEQPREFHLGLNLKTAKGLGISIPPSILVRATDIFE